VIQWPQSSTHNSTGTRLRTYSLSARRARSASRRRSIGRLQSYACAALASRISSVPDHQWVRAIAAMSSSSARQPIATSACFSANGPHDQSFGWG